MAKSRKFIVGFALVMLFILSLVVVHAASSLAYAYTYIKTDTESIFNRHWLAANSSGYFEEIGSDPNGPNFGDDGWNAKITYRYEVMNATDNGAFVKKYCTHDKWTRGGAVMGHGVLQTATDDEIKAANGEGFGCVATHGYAWSQEGYFTGANSLDDLYYSHIWIDTVGEDWVAWGDCYYGSADFWPRVKIQYSKNTSAAVSSLPSSHYKYIGNYSYISETKPIRTGYVFQGWSLYPNGPINIAGGQKVGYQDWNLKKTETFAHAFDNGPTKIEDDIDAGIPSPTGSNVITLYAQWKPVTYYVDYLGNGATRGSTASSLHTYDISKSLTANGYARSYSLLCDARGGSAGNKSMTCNWSFKNWNKAANGSSSVYGNKASVKNLATTQSSRVKLYAQWTPGKVTLPNPGSRTNYKFKGWYTSASGGTRVGSAGTQVSISANTTYYAQWAPLTKVEYYVDGSSSPVWSEVVDSGSSYTVKSAATSAGTRPNCKRFDGWYKTSTYSQKFTNGAKVSGTVYKLYGRNAVTLSYSTTSRSTILRSSDHTLYTNSAMTTRLTNVNSLYPATREYWYGQTVSFNVSRLKLYYIAQRINRVLSPASGVYLQSNGSGSAVTSRKLLKNTTVYVDWPWPIYDGVLDQRS